MKNWTYGAAAIALIAALAGTASAQGDRGQIDFSTLDATGDGILTVEDMEATREARFAEMDTDGDGSISEAEFMAVASERAGDRAAQMFERLDTDGDGVVSQETLEARSAGRGRGPGLERLIERFDEDGDGGLSEAEFETARAEMRERGGERGGRGGHGKGHR